MEIKIKEVSIKEVCNGYKDSGDSGVIGYGGLLNIRPAYQREFVYKDSQRDNVIKTILKGYPLNVMYWAKNSDGSYELMDGQQRTISFCQYVNGDYSIREDDSGNIIYFHNLSNEEQSKFLSYKLFIYECSGSDKERLEWFKTINIAGEKLTDQELLNVNYVGPWLASAKLRFSKNNCVAYKIGSKYVKGSPIRQEYLETALSWISDGDVSGYMAKHQYDENSDELLEYFKAVIGWVDSTFTTYRKEMLGINWGKLYKTYKDTKYDPSQLELKVKELMENEEVTDKKGIYEYVLSGCNEHLANRLSKRTFSTSDKRTAYEKQKGICPKCGKHFEFDDMEGDHIVAWWKGGKTVLDNLQMLCKPCNGEKSGKTDKTN